MNPEDRIRLFLREGFTDERLVALRDHAAGDSGTGEDGLLAFNSCCCFIGCAVKPEHELQGQNFNYNGDHYSRAKALDRRINRTTDTEQTAEWAYFNLADTDFGRRKALLPMINEELNYRTRVHAMHEEFVEVFA